MSPPGDSKMPTKLIAIIGATGSGKSAFINNIIGKYVAPTSDNLGSVTNKVIPYTYVHPSGTEIRIVDTPGFSYYSYMDTTSLSDLEILQMIGSFLKQEYDAKQKLSGVVICHSIFDSKIYWNYRRRHMRLFKGLIGEESMKNVVVLTTFWDKLDNFADGIEQESDLQTSEGFLGDLYNGGAKFVRSGQFETESPPDSSTFITPRQVVDYFLSLDPVYLQMQKEMAQGLTIDDTSAGSTLLEEFERFKLETQDSLQTMWIQIESMKSAGGENTSLLEDLERKVETLQGMIKDWEKYGSSAMQIQSTQWAEYQKQVAAKQKLDLLLSRRYHDLGSLKAEVSELREINNKIRQFDEQRIKELNRSLARSLENNLRMRAEIKRLRSSSTQ